MSHNHNTLDSLITCAPCGEIIDAPMEGYSLQDQEDSTGFYAGSFDQMMDIVFTVKGSYVLTNLKTGTTSNYTFA